MITTIFFAAELLLLQQTARESVDFVQIQDAVLVVRDQIAKGQLKGEPESGSVSFPTSEVGTRPVSLIELRNMVEQGKKVEQRPVQSFVVDRTIGGVNKEKIGESNEGGIAGAQTPIDIRFVVTLGSVIPPSQVGAFQTAVAEVERYVESQISSVNVNITLKLTYTPLTSGRLGFTTVRYSVEKYADFSQAFERSVLGENEITPMPVRSTLPVRYSGVSTSVTNEDRIYLVRPLKIALGLPDPSGPSSILDEGTITMSSAIQWDFEPSDGLRFGQSLLYSFQDHLIREVLQTMGFVAGADFLVRDCTAMDIFRFQQDVIDEAFLVNSATNVFGGNPPVTCGQFSTAFEGLLVGGSTPNGWALDYNPGLNKALISKGAALIPTVTPQQMLGAVTAAVGDLPSPMTFLQNQLSGTGSGNTNSFDDSDMAAPSVPSAQRTASYPDGAVQTIATIGTKCFVIDFRAKVPAVTGPPPLAQINNEFLGAMPRTIARNSVANKSILNFAYGTSGQAFDFEMEMYDGSPIRGAFVKQNELASLGTRCLMGESIGKGNTFYSRDYCSYVNPPTPLLPLDPLGSIPDFLTKREWLILDSMGWNIDMATIDLTDEGDANVTLTCPPPQP